MAQYFKANDVTKTKNHTVTLSNGLEVALSRSVGGGIKGEHPVTGESFCYGQVSSVRETLAEWEAEEPEVTHTAQYKGQQVGYIRVSTAGQNTARQLVGVPLDKTFEEKVSAKTKERPQLQAAMEYCREGDTLHVHSLDRVCRSGAGDAVAIVETLTSKGVGIEFHKEGMKFSGEMTAAQKGVLGILACVAQMERELINERSREGQAAAKAAGKHIGRPKGTTKVTPEAINQLLSEGLTATQAAKKLGIGRATLYRVLKED